jgi:hypothetical protein
LLSLSLSLSLSFSLSPETDQKGDSSQGGPFQERFGFSRVLEALEVTPWPDMAMQPRRGGTGGGLSTSSLLSGVDTSESGVPVAASSATSAPRTSGGAVISGQDSTAAGEVLDIGQDADFVQFSSFLSSLAKSLSAEESAPEKMAASLSSLNEDGLVDRELVQDEQFGGAIKCACECVFVFVCV